MNMYLISATDNDYSYYEDAPESLFCPNCNSYLGEDGFFPKTLKISKLKKDFSFTNDNHLLLSEKAVEFFKKYKIKNITFKLVNSKPKLFVPIIENVIQFNVKKRKTRFEKLCKLCGNYESIVGLTPIFLHRPIINNELCIFKTDISFGSGREKSPVIIAGEKLAKLLKKEFKEIDLHKANIEG